METQDRDTRMGLSAPQIEATLKAAFNALLKGECAYESLSDLIKMYQTRMGVALPFKTLSECRYSLEFLSVHFPSNGSVSNNQFWKVICCLLHEAGGKGVNEPDRLRVYLDLSNGQ